MASGCKHKELRLYFLDDLEIISILLDKHNDLEVEITHLFNKVFFQKNTTNIFKIYSKHVPR